MNRTIHNPFPNVADTTPLWVNNGICYSRVMYATEDEARRVADVVRASGGTVNGGYMHGMPLGAVSRVPSNLTPSGFGWEVTF